MTLDEMKVLHRRLVALADICEEEGVRARDTGEVEAGAYSLGAARAYNTAAALVGDAMVARVLS